MAAEQNFKSFCSALRPLLSAHGDELAKLEEIARGFPEVMQAEMEKMWAAKLGLETFDPGLFRELMALMMQTPVDYTFFFRELSALPDDIGPLEKSFYRSLGEAGSAGSEGLRRRWSEWLGQWQARIGLDSDEVDGNLSHRRAEISRQMKLVNPAYTMREWLVVPAYQQAAEGNYRPLRELQEVLTQPYAGQSEETQEQYGRLKPSELFNLGGVSHYSCSS